MRKAVSGLTSGVSVAWSSVDEDHLCISGTFDDALVTIQGSPDGVTWVALNDGYSFDAPTWTTIHVPPGTYVRISISDPGDATSIDVWVP